MHFSLGTAQLGLDYGVSNRTGQPDLETSLNMLRTASAAGAQWLDTAPAYGNSEAVIGHFRESFPEDAKLLKVCTKLSKGTSHDKTALARSIEQSLSNLRINRIDLLLLHDETALDHAATIECLTKEFKSGRIDKIGVSVYSPSYAIQALEIDEIGAIQVPLNVYDHRLIDADFFAKAKQRGKLVFTRSIFLQGLLLMKKREIPKNIPGSIEAEKQLSAFCTQRGIPKDLFCLAWVRANAPDSIPIFGAVNCKQIEDNVELLKECTSVPSDYIEAWQRTFILPDERLTHPPAWPRKPS